MNKFDDVLKNGELKGEGKFEIVKEREREETNKNLSLSLYFK